MIAPRSLLGGCLVLPLVLPACADPEVGASEAEPDPVAVEGADEAPAERMGRVHVRLDRARTGTGPARRDEDGAEVQVTARFVAYRGLDEGFVRARASLPLLPTDLVERDRCVPEDRVLADLAAEAELDTEPDPGGRELVLVDAGRVTVSLGEVVVPVPVALVPDLLPYMSGVEYAQQVEPADAVTDLSEVAGLTVRARAEGNPAFGMPALDVDVRVPQAPDLAVERSPEGTLSLAWVPADDASPLVLRVEASVGDGAEASAIVCVLSDDGDAWIDLTDVSGLDDEGDLQVSASRLHAVTPADGTFGELQLVVEVRDTTILPAP